MFRHHMRFIALGATASGIMLLGGCSSGEPAAPPSPPPETVAEAPPAPPPELLGAAPAPDASTAPDGLLGATTASSPVEVTSLPAAEPAVAPLPVPPKSGSLKTWRRSDGTLVTAMKPIANPKAVTQARPATARSAPVQSAAKPMAKPIKVSPPPPPKVVAAPPAPLKAVTPPASSVQLAKPPMAPALAAAKAEPAKPVVADKPLTKLQSLQAALAASVTRDATLTTADSLAKGEAGQVTLYLPPTLADQIRSEASKLGLNKAAKTPSAYATLAGDGYEVTPNGRQTAVVKPGEPTTFAWQVKPGREAAGQLTTRFGVDLTGTKPPKTVSLGKIARRVAPVAEDSKVATASLLDRLGLASLNREVTLPGGAKASLKAVLGGALVLLAVVILALLARAAAATREREAKRRKFRTLSDTAHLDPDVEVTPPAGTPVNLASPVLAAAAVGATTMALAASPADEPAADPFIIKTDLPPAATPVLLHLASETEAVDLPVTQAAPLSANLADSPKAVSAHDQAAVAELFPGTAATLVLATEALAEPVTAVKKIEEPAIAPAMAVAPPVLGTVPTPEPATIAAAPAAEPTPVLGVTPAATGAYVNPMIAAALAPPVNVAPAPVTTAPEMVRTAVEPSALAERSRDLEPVR